MSTIYGLSLSRRDLAERTGDPARIGGVRLLSYGDGLERGVRALLFDTGSGLQFSVLVDRAMDICEVSHAGRQTGWHSPTGVCHPGLHDPEGEDGLGWTRTFTGFLATCGLDHALAPEVVPGDNYNYPRKTTVRLGLHGRVGNLPARLTGYGESWAGDDCTLWAEGVVVQAAVFGEVLHLHRRIEADLGGNEIRISDRVVNAGFAETPHMLLYHVNLGFPLIDEGTRYVAPIRRVLWASHAEGGLREQGVGYRTCPKPVQGFTEQVWEHEMAADAAGLVPVAVVNDRLGLGMVVEVQQDQLPCALAWQNFLTGHYVLGVEPSTHHVLGNRFARERGEMIWLSPGEERRYDVRFRVLDGARAIAEFGSRVAGIATQPDTDFPMPAMEFPPLHGAAGGRPTLGDRDGSN